MTPTHSVRPNRTTARCHLHKPPRSRAACCCSEDGAPEEWDGEVGVAVLDTATLAEASLVLRKYGALLVSDTMFWVRTRALRLCNGLSWHAIAYPGPGMVDGAECGALPSDLKSSLSDHRRVRIGLLRSCPQAIAAGNNCKPYLGLPSVMSVKRSDTINAPHNMTSSRADRRRICQWRGWAAHSKDERLLLQARRRREASEQQVPRGALDIDCVRM